MLFGAEQAVMFVLAADVDQPAGDGGEVGDGGEAAVDEDLVAPGAADDAAHNELAFKLDALFAEDRAQALGGGFAGLEDALDHGLIFVGAVTSVMARPPKSRLRASMMMDLPAPVSPVSTVKPERTGISRCSMMAKLRMTRWVSMAEPPMRLRERPKVGTRSMESTGTTLYNALR